MLFADTENINRNIHLGHAQADPKFSGPLTLVKQSLCGHGKKLQRIPDPARMSPKKAKSRKERAAEAVKDFVDASNSSTFSVDSLLADRSSTGRLRKVPVQRPDGYGPEYFPNFR